VMQRSIITGSTGLLGMATARHLSDAGIEVLCIGRKSLSPLEISDNFGDNATYIPLPMECISSLNKEIDKIKWDTNLNCIFYNFAWGGIKSLTAGTFDEQLKNAVHAANAVKTAKEIGCSKFVNVGTLEETYVERHLQNKKRPYNINQSNYALSKLASRNLCKMTAYLEKLDYVHTRLSVPLIPDLSKGTYVASTLRKIFNGMPYDKPKNKQLFDIVLTEDIAKAFYLIGHHGKNKADYFIGTSKPDTLAGYFQKFEQGLKGLIETSFTREVSNNNIFDSSELKLDTGFAPERNLLDVIKRIRKK
jgi:nucleoside-diphosphate-sugar epimerase